MNGSDRKQIIRNGHAWKFFGIWKKHVMNIWAWPRTMFVTGEYFICKYFGVHWCSIQLSTRCNFYQSFWMLSTIAFFIWHPSYKLILEEQQNNHSIKRSNEFHWGNNLAIRLVDHDMHHNVQNVMLPELLEYVSGEFNPISIGRFSNDNEFRVSIPGDAASNASQHNGTIVLIGHKYDVIGHVPDRIQCNLELSKSFNRSLLWSRIDSKILRSNRTHWRWHF